MTRTSRIALVTTVILAGACSWAWGDSLFRTSAAQRGTLIAKLNNFEVGHIITVLIDEEIDSSVNASTYTKKEPSIESEANATDNEFIIGNSPNGMNIIPKEKLPNWSIEAKNELKAKGLTKRKSTLTTSISCLVTRVLDNGNVAIEGEKTVTTNREDTIIILSGLVRARDVSANNTIPSSKVANANITLKGKGPLWNMQRRGILTKILDWFSPY
ncbi:MAG: hypothetical protein GWP08_15260 [Nitrospiraceae bacterium]|nr:hypothetical protein [Nitrospiraceae bacterium]